MKDGQKLTRGMIWVTAVCLFASPLLAQQEGGEKPKPAAHAYPGLLGVEGNQNDVDAEAPPMHADNLPLTGVQVLTLGIPEIRHSYWVPGIEYGNIVQSNSLSPSTNFGWNTTSFVNADVSLLEAWSHSLLSANYSGGGFFSNDPTQGNGQYQQLAAAYVIDKRRWQMLFVDQFSYLPQSGFGFGGSTALALPGITGTLAVPLDSLAARYAPSQTIFTTTGQRYSNASAAQLTYAVNPRGSITLAGVYGLLNFIDSGNVNSDNEILNAGYNYAINRNDTVGLMYQFGGYHYSGNPQAIGDHVGQFVYGRKITGRLGLRLAGGPEVTTFRVAIGGATQKIGGSGDAALLYGFVRSRIAVHYMHGVSGGSGVFTGSLLDEVEATWRRQLTRVWNGRVNFCYAKNRSILSARGLLSPVYDAWLAGAGLGRTFGRTADFSLGYQAQIQNSSVPFCNNPSCGTNRTVHQIFLTFAWHTGPQVLR